MFGDEKICRQELQNCLKLNTRSFRVVWHGSQMRRLRQMFQKRAASDLSGAANAPAEWVRSEIRRAKEITDKPIGVNVMLLSEHVDEVAQVVAEEGVKAVTTGAGNPAKYMKQWKEAGIRVIPVVASVAMARMMERAGADAIVAEGMESGGHIGEQTTMSLLPQVVDAVSVPVIGAGGIGDGEAWRGIDAGGGSGTARNAFYRCKGIHRQSGVQRPCDWRKGY